MDSGIEKSLFCCIVAKECDPIRLRTADTAVNTSCHRASSPVQGVLVAMLTASSVMSEVLVICGVLVEAVSHLRNRRTGQPTHLLDSQHQPGASQVAGYH